MGSIQISSRSNLPRVASNTPPLQLWTVGSDAMSRRWVGSVVIQLYAGECTPSV